MKRFIVLVLVIALCLPVLSSCKVMDKVTGVFKNPVNDVAKMYSVSEPTKVVANVKQEAGALVLNNTYELITGYVDGVRASVYTVHTEEIDSVENGGATEVVLPLVKKTDTKTESIEGIGARVNGGEWNPQGTIWTIERGGMALNLNKKLVENINYEDHVLTFTIPLANAGEVLGEDHAANISSDVTATITDDGAMVTSIELVYNIAGNESKNLPESKMTVKVDYTYDIEQINIA